MKSFFIVSVLLCLTACVKLAPGADPLIVNAERLETSAKGTFDLVVETDNLNRPFFRTNIPGFHAFAEWLREPTGNPPTRRGLLMIQDLDNVKTDYKASKVSSNAFFTAIATLKSSVTQASGWLAVATNAPVTHP